MHIVRGDGVTGIERRRRDLYGDGVRNLATASGLTCKFLLPQRHISFSLLKYNEQPSGLAQMATKGNFGELLPHARGLEFEPHRGGFPSGAKKEWGLSSKAKVRVLLTAQLDVIVRSNH
ncbi:hypothetical protein Tco_1243622 [Tanacetum coccineum]